MNKKRMLKTVLLVTLFVVNFACNKNDDPNDVSDFGESYSLRFSGSSANGTIKDEITVERQDPIGIDKVSLNSVNSDGSTLTIHINIPSDLSPSGKKESVGISIQNLDAQDVWNIEDTYKTFHLSLSGKQRKRAIVDYVIDGINDHFGSLNVFTPSTVTLKREGILLKATIKAILQNSRKNQVEIFGNFEANLGKDKLD